MKKNIHPNYVVDTVVKCSTCGATYEIGTTNPEMSVAICANCHPFYTGDQQIVIDTANKISLFKEKQNKAEELKKRREEIEKKRQEREKSRVGVIGSNDARLTLKDLLKANLNKKGK